MKSELLTPDELDKHVTNKDFRLAFVGMSNAGKSYRSKVLRDELDFMWYEVDQEISNKLGLEDVTAVASWMGTPGDDGYQEREDLYAKKEGECTYLQNLDTGGKNLVFDTTGSVIYLDSHIKNWLLGQCLVVNLDTGEDAIPQMLRRYLKHPKPVSWDGFLQKKDGETENETLERCYPDLLRDRLKKYREFANITVPAKEVYDKTAEETIDVIKNYLLQ